MAGARRTKKRLLKNLGQIIENRVFTLDDVNPKWKDKEFEDLIDSREQKRLVKAQFGDVEVEKSNLNTAIQSAAISRTDISLAHYTKGNALKLVEFIRTALESVEDSLETD